jgi:hypothetical protein
MNKITAQNILTITSKVMFDKDSDDDGINLVIERLCQGGQKLSMDVVMSICLAATTAAANSILESKDGAFGEEVHKSAKKIKDFSEYYLIDSVTSVVSKPEKTS